MTPMRAFVTGGHGFVGRWLVEHLTACGDEVTAPEELDVTDPASIGPALADARPDAVYHLAAFTHVGASWDDPTGAFRVNAEGTLVLLAAARACQPAPRVLVVGSAEAYGQVPADQLPVTESTPLQPVTPYAASKAAAEMVAIQAHLGHGLPVLRVRPFNHVGPGQAPTFVVSSLARNVAEAERKGTTSVRVGNLSAQRDFTDVRDVVAAYRRVTVDGRPGAVYNVCSGRSVAIEDIARQLLALSDAGLELEVDTDLFRPVDVPEVRGDPSLIRETTGWEPVVPLDQTLRDTLEYWRRELA